MFCPHCGKQVDDNAKFCPSCGTPLDVTVEQKADPYDATPDNAHTYNNYDYEESHKGLAICALVFSCLGGLVGIILTIVGLCVCKQKDEKTMCWVSLGICALWFLVGIISVAVNYKNGVYNYSVLALY